MQWEYQHQSFNCPNLVALLVKRPGTNHSLCALNPLQVLLVEIFIANAPGDLAASELGPLFYLLAPEQTTRRRNGTTSTATAAPGNNARGSKHCGPPRPKQRDMIKSCVSKRTSATPARSSRQSVAGDVASRRRAGVADFYAALNDDEKARFNFLPRTARTCSAVAGW
jgi:hypothetical protein